MSADTNGDVDLPFTVEQKIGNMVASAESLSQVIAQLEGVACVQSVVSAIDYYNYIPDVARGPDFKLEEIIWTLQGDRKLWEEKLPEWLFVALMGK